MKYHERYDKPVLPLCSTGWQWTEGTWRCSWKGWCKSEFKIHPCFQNFSWWFFDNHYLITSEFSCLHLFSLLSSLFSFSQGLTGPIGPPGPSGPNGAKVRIAMLPLKFKRLAWLFTVCFIQYMTDWWFLSYLGWDWSFWSFWCSWFPWCSCKFLPVSILFVICRSIIQRGGCFQSLLHISSSPSLCFLYFTHVLWYWLLDVCWFGQFDKICHTSWTHSQRL